MSVIVNTGFKPVVKEFELHHNVPSVSQPVALLCLNKLHFFMINSSESHDGV